MEPVTRCLALVSSSYALCQELCVFVFRGVKPPPKPVSVQAISVVMSCTRLGGCSAGVSRCSRFTRSRWDGCKGGVIIARALSLKQAKRSNFSHGA